MSQVETLPKGGAFTATSEPAQSPAPATPSEDTTMPRDILTADPLTLSDTEHAELVSVWDAALTKALDEGGAEYRPVNPAAIIAGDQYRDRPAIRRELTRSHVRLPYTRIES